MSLKKLCEEVVEELPLQGKAEKGGVLEAEEEEFSSEHLSSDCRGYREAGGRPFLRNCSARTKRYGIKLKDGWNRFGDGKKFFTGRVVVPDTGTCADRLWMPHPQQHPRPGWTGSGATWSGGRLPRLEPGSLPSQTIQGFDHSVIPISHYEVALRLL